MAFMHLDFHSDVVSAGDIRSQKSYPLIGMDPGKEAETYKALYLLHGLSHDHTIRQRRISIERYAASRDPAVVMPNAHPGWYTDIEHRDEGVAGSHVWEYRDEKIQSTIACFTEV